MTVTINIGTTIVALAVEYNDTVYCGDSTDANTTDNNEFLR